MSGPDKGNSGRLGPGAGLPFHRRGGGPSDMSPARRRSLYYINGRMGAIAKDYGGAAKLG
jgi:hypothetical protein